MELIINKIDLINILQVVSSITSRNTSEPIINNVLIEADDTGEGHILFSTTDYNTSFRGKIQAEIIQSGKICINAIKFFSLVKEFLADKIELKTTEQNWIYIIGGNSKVKLPGIESGQFPPIEFDSLQTEFPLSARILKGVIDRTFFSIGENQARKNLTGLNFKLLSGNQVQWLGADGFRITQFLHDLGEPVESEGDLIIPKKSLLDIRRLLDAVNGEVKVSFNESLFQVFSENIFFKTKLIEASYPDLSRIILKEGEFVINAPRIELTNAVRVLAMVSDDKTSSMKVTFKSNMIFVESERFDFGEGSHEVPCEYVGDELSVGFNIKYFLDALLSFDASKAKFVQIHCTGALAPCMLCCEEWDYYKTVLMPMKIKW